MKRVTSTIVTPLSRTLSIRPHVSRRSGIEPGGELVQDGGLGLADQGEHEGQPLLLAARQGPPVRAAHGARSQPLQENGGVDRPFVERRRVQLDGLAHLELGRQRALLELHTEPFVELLPVLARVEAGDPRAWPPSGPQARDALHGCRLAGAIAPEDPMISPRRTEKLTSTATVVP
jgi:hypothetical protein